MAIVYPTCAAAVKYAEERADRHGITIAVYYHGKGYAARDSRLPRLPDETFAKMVFPGDSRHTVSVAR